VVAAARDKRAVTIMHAGALQKHGRHSSRKQLIASFFALTTAVALIYINPRGRRDGAVAHRTHFAADRVIE
jgi:hypothetical protein